MRLGHRRLGAAILVVCGVSGGAFAQTSYSPVCGRLEGQLAMINRGGSDPAQQEQIRRYEEALARQQGDLDRLIAQWRRLGCESMGIFSLFSNQPAECRPLGSQIQDMRAGISRRQVDLQRLQGGDMEAQRESVIAALAQNNCGPQYQAAANQQRGFFASLFGGNPAAPMEGVQTSTYRTLCVRTCDGYFFPVSFQATPARFAEDEQTCQRLCPASEVALYTHRNPGEDVNQSVSLAGRSYRDLPTAFRYRQSLDQACTCRKAGQSWAEALGVNRDTTVERGDIVVTEESSRAMAQPRTDAQGRPIRIEARMPQGTPGSVAQPAGPGQPDPAAQPSGAQANASAAADSDMPSGPVRTVGPPFVPSR